MFHPGQTAHEAPSDLTLLDLVLDFPAATMPTDVRHGESTGGAGPRIGPRGEESQALTRRWRHFNAAAATGPVNRPFRMGRIPEVPGGGTGQGP